MRILVAGGAGYIGSVLVPELLKRGHQVTVVDLLWFGCHLPHEATVLPKDAFSLTQADLVGFERVLFMAGLSNDPMADFAPNRNFISNSAAPAYLAWLAKKAGVPRFLYSGSCAVYGFNDQGTRVETDAAACTTPYGISKYQGEQSALYLDDASFAVTSLRLGTVSGYSPRMRLDLVVNAMFRSAMVDLKVVVFNPDIWRPILGIQDAARAFCLALEAPTPARGVYNVASVNCTVREVGSIVQQEMSRYLQQPVGLELHHMAECRSYRVSSEKIHQTLGFEPRQSIADMVAHLWANKDALPNLNDDQYYNIRFLQNNGKHLEDLA